MSIKVYDSATSARLVKKIGVYDSAGVAKNVKTAWVYNSAGVAQRVFSSAPTDVLQGTLFAVTDGSGTGFRAGLEGDITPMLVINGGSCERCYAVPLQYLDLAFYQATDPGKNYFTQFVSGIGVLDVSASTYSFNGITANWRFPINSGYTNNQNFAVSIIK